MAEDPRVLDRAEPIRGPPWLPQRRGTGMPESFDVPARGLWERGYAAEAGRSLLTTASTLTEALAVVRPFVDPLLAGAAVGRWDPKLGRWTG